MCRSLDHRIFDTNARSRFTRYLDYYKGVNTFRWPGIEKGLNMPSTKYHFRWCRSTLTYTMNDVYETKKMQEIKNIINRIKDSVG